jgi:hypothetical protein
MGSDESKKEHIEGIIYGDKNYKSKYNRYNTEQNNSKKNKLVDKNLNKKNLNIETNINNINNNNDSSNYNKISNNIYIKTNYNNNNNYNNKPNNNYNNNNNYNTNNNNYNNKQNNNNNNYNNKPNNNNNNYNNNNNNNYYNKPNNNSDFEKYFNPKTEVLDEEGMIKIGKDLNIDIYTNMFFPYFFYKCSAKKLDEVTKSEYNKGLNYFKVKSIMNISKNNINNFQFDIFKEDFKNYYEYIFNINNNKNNIDYEIIEIYFPELFKKYKFVNDFITFLKEKNIKNLNKDQYFQFYELIKEIGNKFPNDYNSEIDSWPSLFDEFFYYYCDKNNIKYNKPSDENYY